MEKNEPSLKMKVLFWAILGCFSVFFAEVVSGSDFFPFFTPWGWLVTFPLYALHILVLAHVVFTYGKPRFLTLFAAGAIFGMYEAYMTKVMWSPPWGPPIFPLAGIAPVEMMTLALLWHPLFAFIIPLLSAESALAKSREVFNGLPFIVKRILAFRFAPHAAILLFALGVAAVHSSAPAEWPLSLASALLNCAFILFLVFLWKNVANGSGYELRQLLPNRGEFKILLALLLLLYLILGFALRPEAIPGLGPQMLVWAVYLLLFAALFLSMRKSVRVGVAENVQPNIRFSWIFLVIMALVFAGATTLFDVIGVFGGIVYAMVFLAGIVIGVPLLLLTLLDAALK